MENSNPDITREIKLENMVASCQLNLVLSACNAIDLAAECARRSRNKRQDQFLPIVDQLARSVEELKKALQEKDDKQTELAV